jgi:peptidoglycan-associated lipoprotein
MMRITTIAPVLLAVSLAACASRRTEVPPPVAPPAPPPIQTPTAPPVTAPVQQTVTPPAAPAFTGPRPGTIEDFQITAGDRVFFALDSYALSVEAQAILVRQAAWLSSYPSVNVLVAGNADERGTREYNLALGARRAQAVKDFLVSRGVPAGRVATVSYGKERPIDPRPNEEGWAVNRNAGTGLGSGVIG